MDKKTTRQLVWSLAYCPTAVGLSWAAKTGKFDAPIRYCKTLFSQKNTREWAGYSDEKLNLIHSVIKKRMKDNVGYLYSDEGKRVIGKLSKLIVLTRDQDQKKKLRKIMSDISANRREIRGY